MSFPFDRLKGAELGDIEFNHLATQELAITDGWGVN